MLLSYGWRWNWSFNTKSYVATNNIQTDIFNYYIQLSTNNPMILKHFPHKLTTALLTKTPPYFTKTTNKQKFQTKYDDLQTLQAEYSQQYFDQYREQVEKDSVIRNFRRQIFEKNRQPVDEVQFRRNVRQQENQINRLLSQGAREKINKFSTKIMQHIKNRRNMFKGKQNKEVFKDYADYSAYQTNKVTIQDRNYLNMDNLSRPNTQKNTYQFIESLPQNYQQKQQIRNQIRAQFPHFSQEISISEYGEKLQNRQNKTARQIQIANEMQQQNYFKIKRDPEQENQLDQQNPFVQGQYIKGTLSTQAINTIYDLYIQGWSVREISRRFGILPARAKFHIWSRARLYNQFLPKKGLKYLVYSFSMESKFMQKNQVVDYGLDLDQMVRSDRYEEIIGWESKRVDAQRDPKNYTRSLTKLQNNRKFGKYDMLQVGTDGKQNKKHLLKQWKVYRGKLSDQYMLRNKIFKGLMFETRKIKSVYY